MALTKSTVDKAKYEGDANRRERCVIWDASLPGFGVRVFSSGAKSFILSYRVSGRKRLMTIGRCGAMAIDEARKRARKHLVAVEDGGDPLDAKKAIVKSATVKELVAAYLQRYAKPRKRSWQADASRLRRHVLPKWGNLKAGAIKSADVASLHSAIGTETPYEANRTVALLSKMFALASTWGFVPDGHHNPASKIESFAEHKRDRWVTPEEFPELAKAIDTEASPYVRAALWLYLLTGVRKTELLTARWDDVDFTRKELRLPTTKAGRVHYVPLTEPAIALLRGLPKVKDNPYVLPGARTGAHLVNINKPWKRIRTAAGVEDVRLHDLRRTVGSWLAQAGNSLHLIGRVLNHSNQSTTAVYARFGQDHVREALEAHGKRVMGAAGKTPGAVVRQLTGRGKKR